MGEGHSSNPYSTLEGYPTELDWTVGQRMEQNKVMN